MGRFNLCANCSIALIQGTRRLKMESLSPETRDLLNEWLRREVLPHELICQACFDITQQRISDSTGSRIRELGHTMACFGCGKSVVRARNHRIHWDSPLVPIVGLWRGMPAREATHVYLCHGCCTKANRYMKKSTAIDDARSEESIEVKQPVPRLAHIAQAIAFPGCKCTATTSRGCIFDVTGVKDVPDTFVETATMSHGADEAVKEESQTEVTIKTEEEEVAPSDAYDIGIGEDCIKEEPGLEQLVKSEPALVMKEELPEDSGQDGNEQQCDHGASAPAGTARVKNEADYTSLGDLLDVKYEPKELDIGPTVLQQIDTNYRERT